MTKVLNEIEETSFDELAKSTSYEFIRGVRKVAHPLNVVLSLVSW